MPHLRNLKPYGSLISVDMAIVTLLTIAVAMMLAAWGGTMLGSHVLSWMLATWGHGLSCALSEESVLHWR